MKLRGRWPKRLSAVLVLAACTSPDLAPPVATTTTFAVAVSMEDAPATTARAAFDRGDLTQFTPVEITLGLERHWVALADDEAERAAGLMGVSDLGDFTGLLFEWPEEVTTGFFMKDTLMPLDLYFFDAAGDQVDFVSLVPCSAEPCPVFVSDFRFRWVLETPAGNLASPLGPLGTG